MHGQQVAGQSAQDEYERRAAKDAADRAENRQRKVAFLIATPIVVYLLVRYAGPPAFDWAADYLASAFSPSDVAEPAPSSSIARDIFTLPALAAAAGAAVNTYSALFGRNQTTEAWAKGADGERRTGATLARLADSFVVFHDLPIPRSKANIDHVVVGPTGVFTVETKHYSNDVVINNGSARSGRYPLTKVVAQATRQATVVSTALDGVTVTPLVVIQGAGVEVAGSPSLRSKACASPRIATCSRC